MDESLPWHISFYEEVNKTCPPQEYIYTLPIDDQRHIKAKMDLLLERNIFAKYPLVLHIGGDLWELRVRACTNDYRIIYTRRDHHFMMLHGFHKKTRKLPPGEHAIAKKRLLDLQSRPGW